VQRFLDIDWKLVFIALVTCYVVPWFIVGTVLVPMVAPEPQASSAGDLSLGLLPATLLLASAAGGYVSAKFASNRPYLHTALVVVVGACALGAAVHGSTPVKVGIVATSAVMGAIGAFFVLRGAQR
jgi:hypothetical protein